MELIIAMTILLTVVCIILFVVFLAKNDVMFTFVNEGHARAVKKFTQFHRALVAFVDHDFRRSRFEDGKEEELVEEDRVGKDVNGIIRFEEADYWDIVKLANPEVRHRWFKERLSLSRFFKNRGGLRFVGIPLIHEIHEYRFNWASNEQIEDPESGKTKDAIVPSKEDHMRHILVQEDVYASEIDKAETKELVPMDAILLLTVAVINPRKALFRTQHWLEATHNQIRPRIREYIGTKTYQELIEKRGASAQEIHLMLEGKGENGENGEEGEGIFPRLRREYGVDVRKIQIHTIDPSPEASKNVDFVEKATMLYGAKRDAEAIRELADAEAYRITTEATAIKNMGPDGRLKVSLDALKTTKQVTVMSEGQKLVPTIQVGALDPEIASTAKNAGGK